MITKKTSQPSKKRLQPLKQTDPESSAVKLKAKRNPPWSRDELILALELYLSRGLLDDRAPEVIALSDSLRQLAAVEQNDPEVFRNPNGVAMKLGNFAALDPSYNGKGLSAGGKGDKAIWNEYAHTPAALAAAAKTIRDQLGTENVVSVLVQTESTSTFQPDEISDTRVRLVSSIVRRRGQGVFRQKLLETYGGRCAFTGYDAVDALEAAHILGYMGKESNHVCNGLLLRADLHTLFDLGLVSIESGTMTIVVAPALKGTLYAELEGKQISLPAKPAHQPSKPALDLHFRASRCWDGKSPI